MVQTKADLDQLRCEVPGCGCTGPLVLLQRCHPREPIRIEYFDGVLTMSCKRCDELIYQIAVAQ